MLGAIKNHSKLPAIASANSTCTITSEVSKSQDTAGAWHSPQALRNSPALMSRVHNNEHELLNSDC